MDKGEASGRPHLGRVDMNLLRVFDAVYRTGNVSRAAELLGLSQPATSQALARLRRVLKDALFVRTHSGVEPTPKALRLAKAVRGAISSLEDALLDLDGFDAAASRRIFRLRLSDAGEALFLPPLIARLADCAPHVRLQCYQTGLDRIAAALDGGHLDFAMGVLPGVTGTQSQELSRDQHVLLVRAGHPLTRRVPGQAEGRPLPPQLAFVVARPHLHAIHVLRSLGMEDRVQVIATNFLALPDIVRSSDLAALVPGAIAEAFFLRHGQYHAVEWPALKSDVTVTLHWSRRFEHDPAHGWFHGILDGLFNEIRGG